MFGLEENTLFYILALSIGVAYGVVAQRRQFCFSGSIKDYVLYGHSKRGASLILAILVAVVISQGFSYLYEIDLTATRYYSNINYVLIFVGAVMFGYGMMIADGCCSRHLVRLAQGDRDSFFVILSMALFSYLTFHGLALYGEVVYENQIIAMAAASEVMSVSLYFIVPILFMMLSCCLKKTRNILQCWDGLLIGVIVSLAWYATFFLSEELFMNVSLQSLSFIYPLGKLVDYAQKDPLEIVLVFSVLTAAGVFVGALVSARFNKRYSQKLNCQGLNPPKVPKKMLGGALMGIGGILAIGCTVGQGLSGISTLSSASILVLVTIYVVAYITARQMHKKNSLVACFIFDYDKN